MISISLLPTKESGALYEQIYRALARAIRAGDIARGEKLPSKRALAQELKVSVSTVEGAYELLSGEGYVRARPRSGYYAEGVAPLDEKRPAPPAAPPESPPAPPPQYDFSTSAADSDLFPFSAFSRLMRRTLADTPLLLQKGDARGSLDLRRALCDFLYRFRGVRCDESNLLIGAGAEYLMYTLFCLFPENTVFAGEDPGYGGIFRIAARHGAKAVPIMLDKDGLRPDLLYSSGARVVCVTPSHQFPLGMTMPIGRRAALLKWAEDTDGFIIEDDYDSEFRHQTRPVAALQGLDTAGRVVYMGTFSRSLAPSMRIAYMALPERLCEKWRALFGQGGDSVSRFEQQTLARFISSGAFARHLRRAGAAYTRRCRKLCALIKAGLPGAVISGEQAGLHFLLTVPWLSEKEMTDRAAKEGLRLHGVSEYARSSCPPPSTVLVGFAGLKDSQIESAAARLIRAFSFPSVLRLC